jgi:hypothetical protein
MKDIQQWAAAATELESKLRVADQFMNRILRTCKTTGQVFRLFPDVKVMWGKDLTQKARSPLPRDLPSSYKEFFDTNRALVSDLLFKGSLMPDNTLKKPPIWIEGAD